MTYPHIHKLVLVGLLMMGVFGGEVVAQTTSLPQRHVVKIQDFAFQPPQITVAPGDTVVWVNKDFVPHFVSLANGRWQSDVLEEDKTWELLVDETGSFHYVCIFHPEMAGEVTAHGHSALSLNQP